MQQALAQAQLAQAVGEVPVGAVLVKNDELLATGFNQPISQSDATAHAEIMALRSASQAVGNYRLPGTTLYVTLEPCLMCMGALIHARVSCVVFAAKDSKVGMTDRVMSMVDEARLNHRIEIIGGVQAAAAEALLTAFFRARRG